MWKLLRKDWVLNRRTLALTYVFWSALWLGLPLRDYGTDVSIGAWAGMVSVACGFLPVIVCSREDKFRAAALTCSLPATRRDIVVSKYVGGWLTAAIAAGTAMAGMFLLSAATGWPPIERASALPILVFVATGTVVALTMPFVLRFGVTGLLGLLVGLQLLGIVTLLASAMFNSSALASIETAIKEAVLALQRLREAWGLAAFGAIAAAAIVALNVASCRLSVLIYGRREF